MAGSDDTPGRIVAEHVSECKVDRTRPLCPYPQVARYKGAGSIDDEANFICSVAKQGSVRSSFPPRSQPDADGTARIQVRAAKCTVSWCEESVKDSNRDD